MESLEGEIQDLVEIQVNSTLIPLPLFLSVSGATVLMRISG